jgi:protein SCO1
VAERRALTGAAVLVLSLLLGACGDTGGAGDAGVVSGVSVKEDDHMFGAVLDTPYTFPDASLTDSRGDVVDVRKRLQAPLTLVFFGYTKCPDICQAVMADLASTMGRLAPDDSAQVQTFFITTDPARDDPATLRSYLDRFDPRFEGFTGSLHDIVSTAEQVHVPVVQGPKLPSGGYEITHGTPILGVRPDGSVPILWTEGTSAAKLADDITTILADGIPAVGKDG